MKSLIKNLAVSAGTRTNYDARMKRIVIHVLIFVVVHKNIMVHVSGIYREVVGI